MSDFKNDPPPKFQTVSFKALVDKANERVPDPPVYLFGNGREFFDPQPHPYVNFPDNNP